VAEEFDPTDVVALSALYDSLEGRDVSTPQALEEFILDWEELNAILYDLRVDAYVDMTSDTTNPEYERRYLQIVGQVLPVFDARGFKLKQKLVESPVLNELGPQYEIYLRNIRAEMDIFREENVPLMAEERKLDQEYQKIAGAQQAEFQGENYTLQQLLPFLEETDRETREGAWRARMGAKLKDAAALDDLYDRMFEVREQIARNAGFDDYRDYKFAEHKRFDYTPDDCLNFHVAIERHVVPVVERHLERRRRLLGVETIRPWDVQVDPEGNPPLRPFNDVGRLNEGVGRIFDHIDPELGTFFGDMVERGLLDLENRPGKAPGGYMDAMPDRGAPFIFMNAVGMHRDVETLLHEGGHAFQYYLGRHLPFFTYQFVIPIEFSEVASMSMEYLCRPYMAEFYTEEEIKRLNADKLRDSLQWFPFMAMIDAFQHWFYTTRDHGPEARRARWAELEARFRPGIDWTGIEHLRDIGWQYLHVYSVPFYFIEYAIAQLAAMRIWLNSLRDERGAVEAYKRGLSLGGSRPLRELFSAAGVEFGLDDRTVSAIVQGTQEQLGEA
jgi:oligoendopeptidase F